MKSILFLCLLWGMAVTTACKQPPKPKQEGQPVFAISLGAHRYNDSDSIKPIQLIDSSIMLEWDSIGNQKQMWSCYKYEGGSIYGYSRLTRFSNKDGDLSMEADYEGLNQLSKEYRKQKEAYDSLLNKYQLIIQKEKQ